MNINEKIQEKFERLLAEGKKVFQECGWNGKTGIGFHLKFIIHSILYGRKR